MLVITHTCIQSVFKILPTQQSVTVMIIDITNHLGSENMEGN